VTDAALHLGHLGAGTTLGASDEVTLDAGAAESVLADLAEDAGLDGATAAAAGTLRVGTATMARTVREVTTERGHDPRGFALAAFGGAGPMVAAALADRLGMERVVVPRVSGVLSAFGLLAADETHDAVRTRRAPLADADVPAVEEVYDDLRGSVLGDASDPAAATVERAADCRYRGQGFELTVDVGDPFDPAAVEAAFHAAHERAYGYRMDEPVELVTLRATATIPGETPGLSHGGESVGAARTGERPARFGLADGAGTTHETPVYEWSALPVGGELDGPAIVAGGESTVVLPPDWSLSVDERGTLEMEARNE
jgi:N-methylhydantoinase A